MPLSPVRYVVPAVDVAVASVSPPAAPELAAELAGALAAAVDGDAVAPLLHAPTMRASPNVGASSRPSTRARDVWLDMLQDPPVLVRRTRAGTSREVGRFRSFRLGRRSPRTARVSATGPSQARARRRRGRRHPRARRRRR